MLRRLLLRCFFSLDWSVFDSSILRFSLCDLPLARTLSLSLFVAVQFFHSLSLYITICRVCILWQVTQQQLESVTSQFIYELGMITGI